MLDVVDHVEAAGTVEAEQQRARLVLAEGVLELVAVVELLQRGHDRLDRRRLEAADAGERVAHLLLLLLELALVGEHLPGRPGVWRARLDPLRAGLDELDRVRFPEGALRAGDARPDEVARHGAAHEHHVAIAARHAGAAVCEPVDPEL